MPCGQLAMVGILHERRHGLRREQAVAVVSQIRMKNSRVGRLDILLLHHLIELGLDKVLDI